MEAMNSMIHNQDLLMHLWDEAPRTTVYVQNILSHSSLRFKTSEDMYTGNKPKSIHLKIFGFPLNAHILKEKKTKLDPSRNK